jgi:hypothetical protein
MSKSFQFYYAEQNPRENLLRLHQQARKIGAYSRGIRVSLVVGTLLNLINHPQIMLGILLFDFNGMDSISLTKALLTYAVPFLVIIYGALSALNVPMPVAREAND